MGGIFPLVMLYAITAGYSPLAGRGKPFNPIEVTSTWSILPSGCNTIFSAQACLL
jgi:hypothetical protein